MKTPRSFYFISAAVFASMIGAGCAPKPPEEPTKLDTVIPVETGASAETPTAAPEAAQPSDGLTQTEPTPRTMAQETLAFPGVLPADKIEKKIVKISTTKGEIVFELLPKAGPNAASNFVYLAERKYYDGLIFHRVEPGFVIQGGDPLGNGTGGPGYSFADDPVSLPYKKGIVAMANAGPNTNGSQFFIMLEDNPLPPSYSIFGRVIRGQDVVDKIAIGDVMISIKVEAK